MLPRSTLNSVKERGSNGALRSHLFATRRTRRGGSHRSFSERSAISENPRRPGAEDNPLVRYQSAKTRILFVMRIRNDTVYQCPGHCPLFSFGRRPGVSQCAKLPKNERKRIGEDIMTVQFRWPLGMPLVDHLGSGIWEVRSKLPTRIARTLFFVHEGEIVLLHGFIKKTKKTPQEDRALALRRKNAYIKSSKK